MLVISSYSAQKELLMESAIVVDLYKHCLDVAKTTVTAMKPIRRRKPTTIQRFLTYEALSTNLNSRSYKHLFRLERHDFENLQSMIEPLITKNMYMGIRSGRLAIGSRTRLAVTLRMLAGSSYCDIMLAFHIGRSTAT
eukprot:TRINITY_DN1354_c0_g1_i2.p1 TRINITY_DN1354_c0_g1~~TRINITY_DN1354_c0_g1_i2.p1  ORF type:complete len:138 (+),score=13.01 TRINITY_DN1354_c0_g1_i2:298-711(+)